MQRLKLILKVFMDLLMMVNYKWPLELFTASGWQLQKSGEEGPVTLISVAGSPSNASMHNIKNAIDYQVPTGSTAKIISIVQCQFGLTTHKIKYSDNIDIMTNSVTIFNNLTTSKIPDNLHFDSAIIPSGKYLNVNTGATPMTLDLIIIVYEKKVW